MKNRAVCSIILILAVISVLVVTCKDPTNTPGGLPNTPNGETRLVISMYDSQLANTARQELTALNAAPGV